VEHEERTPTAVLRRNIRRIREGHRLTYVEMSARLTDIGHPIPVLGLRRLERGERQVSVDDLLALSYVLGVAVVDLLVPNDERDDMPYDVTPEIRVDVDRARKWIGGHGFLSPPISPAELARELQWMPRERAEFALKNWLTPDDRAWFAELQQMDDAAEETTNGRSDQED
jgi:transcriptional regulator with XRE-family HTH domain